MYTPDQKQLAANMCRMIEDEHVRLESFLADLRATCGNFDRAADCRSCERERIAACHGQLISLTHAFLELVIEHCENEETLLSEISLAPVARESARVHRKEHARLIRGLEDLMRALPDQSRQGHTAIALREFHARASAVFSDHSREYDAVLLQSGAQGIQEIGGASNA